MHEAISKAKWLFYYCFHFLALNKINSVKDCHQISFLVLKEFNRNHLVIILNGITWKS